MPENIIGYQIKEISQLTGATWAACLERDAAMWKIISAYKVNRDKRSTLLNFINRPPYDSWIGGAMTAGRSRSLVNPKSTGLSGNRIYIFPKLHSQKIIIVGAEKMSVDVQRIWRVLALNETEQVPVETFPIDVYNIVPDLGFTVPYDLPQALDRIFQTILRYAPCQCGWLAVREGDKLEIMASNCADCLQKRVSIESNPILRQLNQSREPVSIQNDHLDWAMVPRLGHKNSMRFWYALPLVVGKRLIGLIVLWTENPITESDWLNLKRLTLIIAPLVEERITFSNLANHLRRLALLNDFAMTISSALELKQIAQRVFALLQRAFGTERISLFVFSSDDSILHHYNDQDGSIIINNYSSNDFPAMKHIQKGKIYRVEDITSNNNYTPIYNDSLSALVLPLKYRQRVIGALSLENIQPNAFAVPDEHLLMVIASQLAALIENGRLRQEAEARARNLSLIHKVVQQVIDLTDVKQVAKVAAELMVKNFAYELTVVALTDGKDNTLEVAGIGGSAAEILQQEIFEHGKKNDEGITHHVLITGQSLLVNDVSQSLLYRHVPGWEVGSEMCVALRQGENVLGIIDVESRIKNAFTQNDLLVLESLAGILASVISNVGQFQKLQSTVDQLQVARGELQENISALRMAEGKLIQAAKLAAVGEMAAGIAHEINNPLTTIAGFAELILDELPRDIPSRSDLEMILRESNRARSVVRGLLDFARQSESMRVRADLNEVVLEVLSLVNHLMLTSGIKVYRELVKNPPWVYIDRNQIKQVILNLVHNALDAMAKGGELFIRTSLRKRENRRWLTVSIRDTGTGISPEIQQKIFDPFFTTRSKDGGTGLGLSVSYGIVIDHEGFIDVESEVDHGSAFIVWLPVEEN